MVKEPILQKIMFTKRQSRYIMNVKIVKISIASGSRIALLNYIDALRVHLISNW